MIRYVVSHDFSGLGQETKILYIFPWLYILDDLIMNEKFADACLTIKYKSKRQKNKGILRCKLWPIVSVPSVNFSHIGNFIFIMPNVGSLTCWSCQEKEKSISWYHWLPKYIFWQKSRIQWLEHYFKPLLKAMTYSLAISTSFLLYYF